MNKIKAIILIITMTIAISFAGLAYAADIETGLIGHWKLDEGSGTVANDSSGNNHNGTIISSPVWKNDIDSPQALEFDGKDDAVELGDINEFEFGPDDRFTISSWLKPTSDALNSLIIGRGDRAPWNPEKWTWNLNKDNNTASFQFGIGDGTSNARQTFFTPTLDSWYHITIVAGKLNENIDFYVNGELQQGKSIKRTIGQLRQADGSFRIGGDKDYPYYFFKGAISDVRIYKRALTQDEINAVLSSIGPKAPLAKGQDLITTAASPKPITLIAQDVNQDPLNYSIVTPPVNGALTGTPPTITYTPNTDFTGNDSFTFKANDGTFDSNIATVTITVVIPAFPGAEGFGATAIGGRGGRVIHVTNLNDSGPGSLREALKQSGKRIIVFDAGGVIELKSPLGVVYGDYTIAGQTAPGGITIVGDEFNASTWIDANILGPTKNYIIRHIRARGAYNNKGNGEFNGMGAAGGSNFILDHISISNGADENLDAYTTTNFTIQWCTIEETGLWGQAGTRHGKGDHNLGVIVGAYNKATSTFHHNLVANNEGRNPYVRIGGDGGADIRNNVIYNWGGVGTQLLWKGYYNLINNTYIVGPSTVAGNRTGHTVLISNAGEIIYPVNLTGNLWYKTLDPAAPPELNMPDLRNDNTGAPYPGYVNFTDTPWWAPYVATESAADSLVSVLNKAGAWPRDTTTRRTVEEVKTRTGGMGVRGPFERFPEKKGPTSAEYDTDRDGMPDAWETAHNLNPDDPADGNLLVSQGASPNDRYKSYTYIEYYINELADNIEGRSGQVYTIRTSVSPGDSGTVLPEYGNYNWELFARGGYNAPNWFGKIDFGTSEYNDGSIVKMKAKPKKGYIFDHWEGDPVDGLTATYISFPALSNAAVTAHFRSAQKYNIGIIISPDNSGNVAGIGEYIEGETITLASYSNTGYKFKRWAGGPLDNATNPVIQFTAGQDLTITAEFEQGEGGDVLIDDFNDQDQNSLLMNSAGNPKKWCIGNGIFKEIGAGNFALTEKSRWYPVALTLGYDQYGWQPEKPTSDIPAGTTVIKFKVYNVGTKDAALTDFRGPWNNIAFYLAEGNITRSTCLYYSDPFRFPTIKPAESAVLEIPISLIKGGDLGWGINSSSKFIYFSFGYFIAEILWGNQIAIDDVAFGRASADPITALNLSPIANAGQDQITRDVDMDGKETVLLNGLKSFDQDAGLIKTWVWSEGGQQIATGFAPSVDLATGTHDITLAITDEQGASSTDTVTIQVLAQQTVPGPYTLTVNKAGAGSGIVTKSLEQELYTHGTDVTLTAIPDTGNVFTGWSGPDLTSRQNPVTITMYSNKSITATFDTKPALEGDVNSDSKVDIKDLIIVAKAFGSRSGDPGWNINADITKDDIVNMRDIVIVARNFGKTG